MKANAKKGNARKGSYMKNYNVRIKKAKVNVFDKMDIGFISVNPRFLNK